MLVYATVDDLDDWITPIPTNADALLRSASLRVREATKTARYTVDGTGLATDATVLQAFKDATCAHAAALATAKVDPAGGGVLTKASTAAAKSVGSASVSYADAASAAAAKASLHTSLCPDAVTILQQAGLLSGEVWVIG